MKIELLDKTRKINNLLQNNNSTSKKVVFSDICAVLSEILDSNILVLSKKGKLLGVHNGDKVELINESISENLGEVIDDMLNQRLLAVLSTKENINLTTLGFDFKNIKKYKALVVPVNIAGERLGTLFIYKDSKEFDIDDIILAEYGAVVVGLEMIRSVSEEEAEKRRKQEVVKSALSTLSSSELEAIRFIFDEIEDNESVLIASKIADKAGITRSVIVNALRKLESAGIIESRSSGMRGTYIRIVNDLVEEELEALTGKKTVKEEE
jgi:codY GAF-like domain